MIQSVLRLITTHAKLKQTRFVLFHKAEKIDIKICMEASLMEGYVDLTKVIFLQKGEVSEDEVEAACDELEQLIFREYLQKNGVAGF